jgi:hypothetical protein
MFRIHHSYCLRTVTASTVQRHERVIEGTPSSRHLVRRPFKPIARRATYTSVLHAPLCGAFATYNQHHYRPAVLTCRAVG